MEVKIHLEILSDLLHQPLDWKLLDEKLRALLVLANLSQNHRVGSKNGEASSLLWWPISTYGQPWWPAASLGPFLQSFEPRIVFRK
ncbi:hypothetical protein SESBI_37842 [Sesbania bispinosa]|nr:hypothetical protein SESBI_37842 [Sesbania bispinosa]